MLWRGIAALMLVRPLLFQFVGAVITAAERCAWQRTTPLRRHDHDHGGNEGNRPKDPYHALILADGALFRA